MMTEIYLDNRELTEYLRTMGEICEKTQRHCDCPLDIKHRLNRGQEFVIRGYFPGPHGLDSLIVGYLRR
jgi:hypothetical protein